MNRLFYLACIQLCQLGCLAVNTPVPPNEDGGCAPIRDGAVIQDQSMAMPACAAAKGLPGDTLICADFSSTQALMALKDLGWDFTSRCPAGWTISNSSLQINDFRSFIGTCVFSTRALTASEYQKYSSFTLSVVQTVDINIQNQTIGIHLGSESNKQQVTSIIGTFPKQRNIYEMVKSALPNGSTSNYQPWFRIHSDVDVGGTNKGWQIESIAVLGNL